MDFFVSFLDWTLFGQGLNQSSSSPHREASKQTKLTSLFGSHLKFVNKVIFPTENVSFCSKMALKVELKNQGKQFLLKIYI